MPRKKKKEEAIEEKKQKTSEKASEKADESSEELEDTSLPDIELPQSSEFSYSIKIPKDRIAALIGVKGQDKKELEDWSRAKISVDSNEGDVLIMGKDALKLYELREVVQAIARGFSPETARQLLKPDYLLELINLKDYGLDKPNKMMRVKARVIGTGGKARRVIEDLTGTQICVYGKTIGIIGEVGHVTNAKRAIELIIKGSMHSSVYKWLEDQRRKARKEEHGF
jgi:ribosomal RNA assembly protein